MVADTAAVLMATATDATADNASISITACCYWCLNNFILFFDLTVILIILKCPSAVANST
jgi:hypothetical protein